MSTPTEIRQMLDNVLQSGGGTEEIIAALMKAGGTRALFEDMPPPKRGRPRKHADDATKHRAFRARKRARNAIRDEMPTKEGRRIEKYVKAQFDRVAAESSRDEIRDEILPRPTSMLARSTCVGASTKWREGRSTRVPTSNRSLPLSATRPATSTAIVDGRAGLRIAVTQSKPETTHWSEQQKATGRDAGSQGSIGSRDIVI